MSNSQKILYNKKNSEVMSPSKLTVFVSGLNYQTTAKPLEALFGKCGKIERINLQMQPNGLYNQGFCHIIYEDQVSYQNALKLDGIKIDGRALAVYAAKAPTKIEKIKDKLKCSTNITLFVRNIPYDATEAEIQELFGRYGIIKSIRIPICKENPKKRKGIAFVDFIDSNSLIEALELDGFNLRGRYLKLDADISYDESTNTKIKNLPSLLMSNQLNLQANNNDSPKNSNSNKNLYQEEIIKYQEYLMKQHNENQNMNMYYNNMYYPDMQNQLLQNLSPVKSNNDCQNFENYFAQEQLYYNNLGENQQNFNMQNNVNYEQQNYQYINNLQYMNNYQELNLQSQNTEVEKFDKETICSESKIDTEGTTEIFEFNRSSRSDSCSIISDLDCDYKEMVDPQMLKEIENFRKILDTNEKSFANNLEENTIESAKTQGDVSLDCTIFGEAMLKTSEGVDSYHNEIDYIIFPFYDKQNKGEKAKKLPSNLLQFSKERKETAVKNQGGFSLSSFWKKQ